jgi:hypothetical protein
MDNNDDDDDDDDDDDIRMSLQRFMMDDVSISFSQFFFGHH